MEVFASIGWGLFGLAAISLAILALRTSGLKSDLTKSEIDRDRLADALRKETASHRDDGKRFEVELGDHLQDLSKARDDLDHLYRMDPALAKIKLDEAISRARAIGRRAHSPSAEEGD